MLRHCSYRKRVGGEEFRAPLVGGEAFRALRVGGEAFRAPLVDGAVVRAPLVGGAVFHARWTSARRGGGTGGPNVTCIQCPALIPRLSRIHESFGVCRPLDSAHQNRDWDGEAVVDRAVAVARAGVVSSSPFVLDSSPIGP